MRCEVDLGGFDGPSGSEGVIAVSESDDMVNETVGVVVVRIGQALFLVASEVNGAVERVTASVVAIEGMAHAYF